VGQYEREVVAAQVARHALVALGQVGEAIGYGAQHLVAGLATVPLVEQLEVLDVQVDRLVAALGVRFEQRAGLRVERGGVVDTGELVTFAKLPYLGVLGVLLAGAHLGVDVGDEAHDHRLAALASFHGHDGLRHPPPAAVASQLAELAAQRAVLLLDTLEQGVEVPEPLEPLTVLGIDHVPQHVVEHGAELSRERRHGVLAGLVVQHLVRVARHVDLEQLVVGRRLPQRGEQAAAPVVNGPAREQHAGAAVEPVHLEARDLVPPIAPRAEDDGLGGVPAVALVPVPGAVIAGIACAAERLVADGAHLAAGEGTVRCLVHVHDAMVAVDDVRVPVRRRVPEASSPMYLLLTEVADLPKPDWVLRGEQLPLYPVVRCVA